MKVYPLSKDYQKHIEKHFGMPKNEIKKYLDGIFFVDDQDFISQLSSVSDLQEVLDNSSIYNKGIYLNGDDLYLTFAYNKDGQIEALIKKVQEDNIGFQIKIFTAILHRCCAGLGFF